ncbi:MAG: hypothetical protein D6707_04285 [Bacteroidetes bacterium]|nr:MAG: hypothetical protein D6707_04285 [Bacteroidota bacterium]
MKHLIHILLVFLFWFTYQQNIIAQVKRSSEDTLKTNDVIIVKEYEPTIVSPKRIEDYPSVIEAQIEPPKIKYTFLNKQYPVKFNIEPIKPASMRGEPLSPLTKGYFKGGVGNYKNTFADLSITTGRSRKHLAGLNINHLGSGGNIKGYGDANFSNNHLLLFGKKFLRQHLLAGNLQYNYDRFHFYGYPDSLTYLNKDNTLQNYHKINGNVSFTSFFKDTSAINYHSSINASYLTETMFAAKELYIQAENNFKKRYSGELIKLNTWFDINNFQSTVASSSAIVNVNPEISSKGKHYQADVGLNIMVNAADVTKFHFYPNAKFKYNLYKEYIIPYVGVSGGIQRNNLHSLYARNPFLANPYLSLRNTNELYKLYGGIKGAYSSTVSFDFKAIKKKQNNLPLFVLSDYFPFPYPTFAPVWVTVPSFAVIYDNVETTELSAEITWQKTEKLDFIFQAQYFSYRTENEFVPWYLPDYQLKTAFQYDILDKLILRGQLFVISPRKAKTLNPSKGDFVAENVYSISIPAIYDINLGLEYRYSKRLSAFLNINNIASVKYYQWENYPVQGLNILGGISFSFLED